AELGRSSSVCTGSVVLTGPMPAIHRLTGGRLALVRESAGTLHTCSRGPGNNDELPGAACVKNLSESVSERHRSAYRYLNAGPSRPSQARLSTRPVGMPGPITP